MRIAIRDTTDSHTVGFFDNKAGIKFKSAEMTQFLKGACSYVLIKYRSKDVEKVRAGCKLAFRHKGKDYWLTINEFNKQGTEVEITAYSLSLEANKEKRGAYKASSAMSIVDYFSVFDPEKSFEIGINEVSDKKLTLEWTGTDTVLARLYSIANSFDAELEFVTELNPNYSLKSHVVNIYRSGNLGGDSTGRPVRVGTELKVLGFNSNINDLYTAIDVTGKDGLKLPDKTIKDSKGEVQFFSKNGRLYAPQARDKFPSNKVNVNDGYILAEAKTTDYTNQEALFGYALSEMKKHCDVQVEYSTEGAVKGSVGDTKTLIDSINFEPALYVQARITEQTEDLETGKSIKTTFSNFKRTSSQLSSDLTKKIEELAKSAVPYRIVMVTSNGTSFKNGTGQSIVSPKLFKGDVEITDATYRFNFNNNTVAGLNYTVNASAVNGTSVLKIDAYVGNDVVANDELTFINVNDGLNGSKGADGNGIASTAIAYQAGTSATVAPTGTWVTDPPNVPAGQFLWTRTIFTYTDKTTKTIYNVSRQGVDGPKGDPGKDGQNGQIPHIAYADKSTDVLVDAMPTFAVPASFSGSTLTSTKISSGYKFTSTGGNSYTKQVVGFSGTTGKNVYTYLIIKNTHATNDIVVSFNGIGAVLNENFSNVTVKPGQTYVDYRPAICRDTYNFLQISILATAIANDLSYEIYDFALYNTNPFINFSFASNGLNSHIGMYQDTNTVGSTDPTKYNWSLMRGLDGKDGVPGTPGADGKTPYWHTAWANSADGKTDFSLTDSKNKQFRGEYIDYIQADSTDPTKYKWLDMTANVKAGGINYIAKSNRQFTDKGSKASGITVTVTDGILHVESVAGNGNYLNFDWLGRYSEYLTPAENKFNEGDDFTITFWCKRISGTGNPNVYIKSGMGYYPLSGELNATEFKPISYTGKWGKANVINLHLGFYNVVGVFEFEKFKLEKGNIATDYSESPEDTQIKIDSKADQALTQEQLIAIAEEQRLMKASLEASASLEEFQSKSKELLDRIQAIADGQKVSEQVLVDNASRIVQLAGQIGAVNLVTEAITKYMSFSDDGLIIGMKDGSSSVRVANDRISFYSAGKETAFISQGFLQIESGIFTLRLQIASFLFEESASGQLLIKKIR